METVASRLMEVEGEKLGRPSSLETGMGMGLLECEISAGMETNVVELPRG